MLRKLALVISALATLGAAAPKSVYQFDPVTDGVTIGTTALGATLPNAFDSDLIHVRSSVNVDELNSLDRHVVGNRNIFAQNLSDVTEGLAIVAPVALDYFDVGWTREFLEDMVVYAEVLSVNGALTNLFKFTVQRPIPRVYAGTDADLSKSPKGYESFYSGHVATTFAALGASSITLGLRHSAGIWPWLVTIAVGASVAAERVAAGRHFYTDVGVATLMGSAVGAIVPILHKRDANSKQSFNLAPVESGAMLTWTRDF